MKKEFLINQSTLNDMLGHLEEVKKKLANNNESDSDNNDSTADDMQRILQRDLEEIQPEKNILGNDKDTIEIKKDDFENLIIEILEVNRLLIEKEKEEKKKEIEKYNNALKDTQNDLREKQEYIRQIENDKEWIVAEKKEIIYKKKRLDKAKDEINACINQKAKKIMEEYVENNLPSLKNLNTEMQKKIEREIEERAKREEQESIRKAEEIARKYKEAYERDDDWER